MDIYYCTQINFLLNLNNSNTHTIACKFHLCWREDIQQLRRAAVTCATADKVTPAIADTVTAAVSYNIRLYALQHVTSSLPCTETKIHSKDCQYNPALS